MHRATETANILAVRRSAHSLIARSLLSFAICASSSILVSPSASAQPAAAKDAAALKAKGDEAMLGLKYEEALRHYERAYETSKDPALLYNQGRALAALTRLPEALAMFEAFNREAPATLKAKVPDLAAFMDEIRSKIAILTVHVRQPGATVRLGDVVLGAAPLDKRQVNAGAAKIVITAEGFEPLEKLVELPGAKETALDFALVPKDKRGTLVVRSVAGASVTIDGAPAGDVPSEVRLAPGPHEITLEHPDYYTATSKVVLAVGERKVVDVPLEVEPAAYETWWFWTILGGVAAGGAAVGIGVALTTERGNDEGSIPPGSIVIRPEGTAAPGLSFAAAPRAVFATVALPF